MASQSSEVEDTFKKMKCAELADALRKILDDKCYKSDLEKLEAEKIDGELFLTLRENSELLSDLKLSAGGKAKVKAIIQEIKDGTLVFGQADNPVEPDIPWCSTQTPADTVNGSGNWASDTDFSGMQKAYIPSDAVWPCNWKNCKKIYVKFLNTDLLANWTIGNGQTMNTDTILRYANKWSDMGGGKIPCFVEAEHGETAQIRVSFNNNQVCNSHLGKRAQNIPASQPTMYLDLHNRCTSDDYKKHVIIHEFGHALGLGHEHQRSMFWSCIKPYTDIEKMKKDLNVNDEQFAIDWKEIDDTEAGYHTEEYDPDSIMHYWFKVKWLTNGYSDRKKVEKDQKKDILSEKVAKALLGVHKRRNTLADKPSPLDIQLLKKVYGDDGTIGEGTTCRQSVIEQPPADDDDLNRPKYGRQATVTDSGDIITSETDAGGNGVGIKNGVSKGQSGPTSGGVTTEGIVEAPKQKVNAATEGQSKQGRLHVNDDLNTVKNELWEVRAHWSNIGGALGVKRGNIESIDKKHRDPGDCLGEMIATWLQGATTPENQITWASLVAALKQKTLEDTCGAIAEEITKKYNVQ